jgi:hypothetical protein
MRTDRQTGRKAVAFRNFAKAPKNEFRIEMECQLLVDYDLCLIHAYTDLMPSKFNLNV